MPRLQWIFTKPSVALSSTARSTADISVRYVSMATPVSTASRSVSPTCASSGSEYVHHGMFKALNLALPKNSAFRITMRAMASAVCVNLYAEQMSPAA